MAIDWSTIIGLAGNVIGNIGGAQAQKGAINQSSQYLSQGADNAMNILMKLYDQNRNDLAGFRAMGGPALEQLSALTFRGGAAGSKSLPNFSNLPQSNMAMSLASATPGIGTGGLGNPNIVPLQNQQNAATKSSIGGLVGAGVGTGLGAAGLLGAGALGGPVGLAITGALAGIGALIGKFWNNHNPDKTWASNSINEVSKLVHGDSLDDTGGLIGAVKSGQMTPEQGKQQFALLWNGWKNAMKNAGLDQSIIDRSVKSQSGYFKNAFDFFNGGASTQQTGNSLAGAANAINMQNQGGTWQMPGQGQNPMLAAGQRRLGMGATA